MAENDTDNSQKEFEASEAKRRKAREEGDVPQSKEANAFALMVGVLVAAAVLQFSIGGQMFSDFSAMLYRADDISRDIFEQNGAGTKNFLSGMMVTVLPLFLIPAAVVFAALVVQRALTFSTKKIAPDMKKINPIENLKKKYGAKGLVDFAKDTAKMLVAGGIAAVFLIMFAQNYYAGSAMQIEDFARSTFMQVVALIGAYSVFQFILAAIDLPIQQQFHSNKLRMTREEVKKESKESEGDPQMKQSRREKASKISKGQMLKNVETATVMMVNPEHYAVALKWDPESPRAPVVVAKGVDALAAKMREIAMAHDVPIHRDPPSTRAIYATVDIDEEILPEHFAAVAAAIKFVERVRGQRL